MGTSKGYGGPGNGLIPSFVDDPTPPAGGPLPGNINSPPPSSHQGSPSGPDSAGSGPLGSAQGNLTRFIGGSRSALGRAVSGYVRIGIGGGARAARRMGGARTTARGLLGLVRDFGQVGPTEALRRLNLDALASQPARVALVAMIEFLCPPGGPIDEGLARQALLDAINDIEQGDSVPFADFSPQLMQDLFLDFIVRSIEARLMADLGENAIGLPDDVKAVQDIQEQVHDFIEGSTRGLLSPKLDGLPAVADAGLMALVDAIYASAYDLVAEAGERLA
jgi:hypothetical protein